MNDTTTGNIRQLKLGEGDQGTWSWLGSKLAGQAGNTVNGMDLFNLAMMDLLKRYQQLGTGKFAKAGLNAQENMAQATLAKAEPGMSPAQQSQIRQANVGSFQPEYNAAQTMEQTFGEQMSTFGNLLTNVRGIQQSMQDAQDKARDDARTLIQDTLSTVGGDAFKGFDEKELANLEKTAGFPKGFLSNMTATLKERELQQQKDLAMIKAGSGTGLGTGAKAGSISYDELSALSKSVVDGTAKLSDLTPSTREKLLPELNAYGWTSMVASETRQSINNVIKGVDDVMAAWKAIPNKYKGYIQGLVTNTAKLATQVPELATYEAAKGIVGMELTRLYEKGRISDQDRLFYMSRMPSIRMNETSAQAAAEELKARLKDTLGKQASELESAGTTTGAGSATDVNSLRTKYGY